MRFWKNGALTSEADDMAPDDQPLSGIRILDLSRAMAGPFCTQLLGDLGAQVVKVESLDGDETRRWGPFWNGVSCYFLSANRNKRSIALDLKHPEGLAIACSLADQSDVVVENFRPGTVNRLGLDYETLAARNPRLIYCSVSGFGQDGPRAQEAAYDVLMQGFAGLLGLTGIPGGPPVRAGLPVTDYGAGLFATTAILTALYRRQLDGQGQKVETSLLEGQLTWLGYYMIGYLANGEIPPRMGSAHPSLTPYKAYRAGDDYFVLAVGNDGQWKRLCQAIDAPELADDPRFVTNIDRLAHREEQDALLEAIFARFTAAELIQRINRAGVPGGPINTVDQIIADPQVQHLGMVPNVPHPDIPELQLAGIPIHLSRTPGAIQSSPPQLGEHTDEILDELGYAHEVVARLRQDNVVG